MRKMAFGIVMAIVVAAVSFSGRAPAWSESSKSTLKFFQRDTQRTSLDLGDAGTSPGDRFLFGQDLLDHPGETGLGLLEGLLQERQRGPHFLRSGWPFGWSPAALSSAHCHPSYPAFCIPPPPPDLNCDSPELNGRKNFTVRHDVPYPDPHGFDRDKDGIGCESG